MRSTLVLLVGCALSVTACGGSGSDEADDDTQSSSPSSSESDTSGATDTSESSEPTEDVVQVKGQVTGTVNVELTLDGRSDIRKGGLTFALDCSAGTTCTTGDWSATGDLSNAAESFFRNYMDLAWQGGSGEWVAEGGTPAGCDSVDPADVREFVSGTLKVDDSNDVSVETTFDEYAFKDGQKVCNGAGIQFSFTGTVA